MQWKFLTALAVVGAFALPLAVQASSAAPTSDTAALSPPADPPTYVGLRLDRSWTFDGSSWSPVDTLKTLGAATNFQNAPLPSNGALDTGTIQTGTNADGTPILTPVNPGAANAIQSLATKNGTYINRATFTPPITRPPADTPLQPVWCAKCASDMRKMLSGDSADFTAYLGGGVPIPADYQPAAYPPDGKCDKSAGDPPNCDTDAEFVAIQPDYQVTCGTNHYVGRMYEVWRLRRNLDANGNQIVFDPSQPASATNAAWTAGAGGRVVNLATSPGHYRNVTSGCSTTQPGAANSTYQLASWQMLAAGTHLAGEMDSREDCQRYALDGTVPPHALGLQVTDAHTGKRWPAQSYDGGSSTLAVQEGMRLRVPPGATEPAGQTRAFDMIWKQAQRYGFVVDDRTFSSVGPRFEAMPDHTAAPECSQLLDGQATSAILKNFPFSQLEVLAVGSDSTPNP